jgi:hypothetical protein
MQCILASLCTKTVGTISKRMKRIPSRIGTKAGLYVLPAILISNLCTFIRLL